MKQMHKNINGEKDAFYIWHGIYPTFKSAMEDAIGTGFEGEIYRERSLAAARECMSCLQEGRPIPQFHKQRSTLLPVVVAMMLCQEERVKILDFGGGLGIGFMTLAESIPMDMHRVAYTIVEGPHVSELGSRTLGSSVEYTSKLPSTGRYSLIHAASSLQYVEDWQDLLKDLSALDAKYILLSDIFAGEIRTFVSLQNYYGCRIPHWFLNLAELLDVLGSLGYTLKMKTFATSRRLDVVDVLPMDNLPESCRLTHTLHLLLERTSL
jgi:putative methyltransferase (TIGR04325 family)